MIAFPNKDYTVFVKVFLVKAWCFAYGQFLELGVLEIKDMKEILLGKGKQIRLFLFLHRLGPLGHVRVYVCLSQKL